MNTVLNFSPIAIFIIMLGVGLSINIKKFLEVAKDFKALLIGLVSQIVILPIIGFLFAIFAPIDLVLN
jgi:BASS family bile acid:Na+ symporter